MIETSGAPAAVPQTRPSVRYVHHVSLRVNDLRQALDFYGRLLGCTEVPRPDFSFPGAWLQADDVQVHLMEVPANATTGFPPSHTNPCANHVAFHVDDLVAFGAFLTSNGFATRPGFDPAVTQVFVQDPSGNVIEFTSAHR